MFRLFVYQGCPFCHKVQNFMNDAGLKEGQDFELVDGHGHSEELVKLGGKQQVPFLIDGNVKMFESDDIIEYLKKKI